jgi:[ribosomal protein S18]-alanine N-acetyltransferase
MTTVRIGSLRRQDLAACAALEQELFAGEDPWREAMFASELDHGNFYLGAYAPDGTLVGYAGLAVVGAPGDAEASVHTIAVSPAWQGRGVGTALLDRLLAHADALGATTFLEVRTDNVVAMALYTGRGFELIGLRRRYYQPSGADAYTMRRLSRQAAQESILPGETRRRDHR